MSTPVRVLQAGREGDRGTVARCPAGMAQCLLLMACSTSKGPNPLFQQCCSHCLCSWGQQLWPLGARVLGQEPEGGDSTASKSARIELWLRTQGWHASPITEELSDLGQVTETHWSHEDCPSLIAARAEPRASALKRQDCPPVSSRAQNSPGIRFQLCRLGTSAPQLHLYTNRYCLKNECCHKRYQR